MIITIITLLLSWFFKVLPIIAIILIAEEIILNRKQKEYNRQKDAEEELNNIEAEFYRHESEGS